MEVQIGLRVVRGPNWRWGDQDGGEGHVGTVIEVQRAGGRSDSESTRTPCVVTVQWDCGNRCRYRCGIEDKYDLRVIDSAPAGIRHHDVVCDGCAQEGITGIRWKCVKCNEYDLCTMCYLNGKHRFEHEFERMDTPTLKTRVPARHTTKKKEIRGIFVHAEVIPGYDWQQPPGEGAPRGSGVVVGIQGVQASDNSRSFAVVLWKESQVKTIHRVGHEGKVDLKCVDSASGGYYYPDHLPVLGAPLVSPGPQDISTGDLVRVELEADIFKAMQEGHGGWSDPMLEVLGKIGTVQAILDSGDLRVKYSVGSVWTIGPEAVAKVDVPQFKVGDKVRVLGDVKKVSELQKGHGDWSHNTALFLGEICSVISVLSNGDLGLVAKGRTGYFNPLCVTPADEDGAALSSTSEWYKHDTDELMQIQRLSLFEQGNSSVVFAATMASDISMLRSYLQRHPEHVDAKYDDRAALHQAAGIGNVPLTKLLLEFGATVDIEDDYSLKPLHLSVISGHVETTKCLLDANADVNTKTVEGLTPLMYAAQLGHVAVAKVLLSHPRIQIHEQNIDGNTALHTAVFFRKNRMVFVLLEAGADPTLLNFQLFTSIHYAAWMGFLPAIEHILERFPEHSNLKNDYGYAILHVAAFHNHCDIVNLAAEQRGCEIDVKNDRGQTPLHVAILRGHSKIVERLVGYGAGVNTQDEDGNSPLYMILSVDAMEPPSDDTPELKKIHEVLMGDLKSTPDNALPVVTCMTVTVFFLRKGADMHIKNKKGASALQALPFLATLMSLIVESEDLFEGDLPPGHIGLFPSEFGGNLQIQIRPFGQSGSKQGRGYSQSGYGYDEHSSYSQGQSTLDYYGDQDSYSYGGDQASTSQRSYSRAGKGSPYGGSGAASGEGNSYMGTSTHAGTYSQTTFSPGYAYGYGGGSSASGGSANGKGRSYSHHGDSYSPTTSSYGYAYDYGGEQSYTGAYSSAYDPDDEEPKSKHSRPPAVHSSQVLASTHSAPVLSTARPKGGKVLCFLCDNPADIRFSPCGHSAMCHECAPRAKRCPTCRNPVDGFSDIEGLCIKCAREKATVTRPCGHKFCTACDQLPVCFGCTQADLD